MDRNEAFVGLSGVGTALVTPFCEDGRVDVDALDRLVVSNIEAGVNFLCVLGTTAETPTLTDDEQHLIRKTIVRIVEGRLPLLLGFGGNDTAGMLRRMKSDSFEGMEEDGPFILAPNHQCYFDGIFVISFLSRKLLSGTYFFAKRDHVRNRFAQFMARHNNVIVIDDKNLKESIQTLGEVLKRGGRVIIFPEGTRTTTGALGPFKKMFAILSRELNVPIVPVAISGAYKAMPKGRHLPKRVPVEVTFLPPVFPLEKTYDILCDEVMNRIEDALY